MKHSLELALLPDPFTNSTNNLKSSIVPHKMVAHRLTSCPMYTKTAVVTLFQHLRWFSFILS